MHFKSDGHHATSFNVSPTLTNNFIPSSTQGIYDTLSVGLAFRYSSLSIASCEEIHIPHLELGV